jgi:hypothetical protein
MSSHLSSAPSIVSSNTTLCALLSGELLTWELIDRRDVLNARVVHQNIDFVVALLQCECGQVTNLVGVAEIGAVIEHFHFVLIGQLVFPNLENLVLKLNYTDGI